MCSHSWVTEGWQLQCSTTTEHLLAFIPGINVGEVSCPRTQRQTRDLNRQPFQATVCAIWGTENITTLQEPVLLLEQVVLVKVSTSICSHFVRGYWRSNSVFSFILFSSFESVRICCIISLGFSCRCRPVCERLVWYEWIFPVNRTHRITFWIDLLIPQFRFMLRWATRSGEGTLFKLANCAAKTSIHSMWLWFGH